MDGKSKNFKIGRSPELEKKPIGHIDIFETPEEERERIRKPREELKDQDLNYILHAVKTPNEAESKPKLVPINEISPVQTIISSKVTIPQSTSESETMSLEADISSQEKVATVINEIVRNITEQPKSIQDFYNEMRSFSEFSRYEKIQGFELLLGKFDRRTKTIPLLIREEDSNRWKYRIFRLSGSDKQFKCHNGFRGDLSIKKGEEENPKHHYAQSNKPFYEITQLLDQIYLEDPNGRVSFNVDRYLPVDGGRYVDEDELKETYFEPKNQEMQTEMDRRAFEELHLLPLCKMLETIDLYFMMQNFEMFKEYLESVEFLKEYFESYDLIIEEYNKILEDTKNFAESQLSGKSAMAIFDHMSKSDELISRKGKFFEKFKKYVIEANTKRLQTYTLTFEPDFDKDPILKTYEKNGIQIEEYLVETPEGDKIVFAMAHDAEGRVYIDNIYSFPPKMSSYGTYENIVNFGKIVYKPIDYTEQTTLIDPELRYEINNYYSDISDSFALIPLIKRYRAHLEQKGVYVRPIKSSKFE
jgi:hypothetical protein